MHPRNFGSHMTIRPPARPPIRPQHRHANVKKNSNNRYGNPNATQGFIWQENAWPPGLLERKNNNKVVSSSTLFLMCTLTWNRERVRVSDCKQRRRISLQEKHENVMAAVRKWEMLAASKVKMSGSEKIKRERNTSNKIFVEYIRQFLLDTNDL